MRILVIADEHGNQIVRRTLKEGEDPAEVFKEEEQKYINQTQSHGN